ncbi:hypothetical protein JKF63_05823 [Porcisia hertigi]|uniref:Uncharacterized protein n=1 Tax=Porcisia hertigi TaxID=2761500 RepID=A0A836IJR9_9TRYP|nr:hypothetical protein JKF63_05823 [Porcisia hertigi]
MEAQGEKVLIILNRLLATAASSTPINDDPLRWSQARSRKEDAGDADTDDAESTRSGNDVASGPRTMSYVSQPVTAPPPAFLNGALGRLRLFLAARHAMLMYERQQQNMQWGSLLSHIKLSMNASSADASLTLTDTHGSLSNLQASSGVHNSRPQTPQGPATANARPEDTEESVVSVITAPSTFASVLQRRQQQLDAFTAAALCPLRCQMCPAFTTPQLQRVDAWSYAPLQATTAFTTAFDISLDTDKGKHAKRSSLQGVCNEPDGSWCQSPSHSPPILALLMRSDTAIDTTASSSYIFPSVRQVAFVDERDGDDCKSHSSALSANSHHVIKCSLDRQTALRDRSRRLVSPWQSCNITGSLISSLPFRYSLSAPLEDVRRAAQDAKQRRAMRTLYGGSAPSGGNKNILDQCHDGSEFENYSLFSGDGTIDSNLANLYAGPATLPPPTKPSFYYEAQLSLEYLIALYVADNLGTTSPAIGDDALAHGTRGPLSQNVARRLCKNCVVVGLCDSITAAQANGSTRGLTHPYLVAHLGHKHDAGDIAEDMGSDGMIGLLGPKSDRGHIQDEKGAWSAGVSVSVIAHEELTPPRVPSPCADGGAPSPNQVRAPPRDSEVETDVFYLSLWKHQQNSVRALTSMQAQVHHTSQDDPHASESTDPVYLRLELPRRSTRAPAKAETTQDVPNIRVAATSENLMNRSDANAAAPMPAKANLWLPTITRASRDDVARALLKARQKQQQQQQSGTTQRVMVDEGKGSAKSIASGAPSAPGTAPSRTLLPRVLYEVPATLVLGVLFDSSAGTLRLRLNNYTDLEEIVLGTPLGSEAKATNATESTTAPSSSPSPPALPIFLYPAATLSLNDDGWRSWHDHQTREWAELHEQDAQRWELGPSERESARVQVQHGAPLPSASFSKQPESSAVLHFRFDMTELLFAPPPPPPHKTIIATSTDAMQPAMEITHLSQRQPLGGRVRAPTGVGERESNTLSHQPSEPIALLDSTLKFTQMLSVLTDVSLCAGVKQSRDEPQEELQSSRLDFGDHAEVEDEETDDDDADTTTQWSAVPHAAHSSVSLIGSRERRIRAAIRQVHRLLNTPGGGAVLDSTDPPNIFYPPVRIYRHSCHLPPQELYPLLPSPDAASGDEAKESRQRRQQQQRRWRQGNRRIGLEGTGGTPSLASANMFWHDIIPENAPLTPLCAALASRQPNMAYVIATHPLTSFCDPVLGEKKTGSSHIWQQQHHQRRTALYAACALGYAQVVQVLLERIPVEELLSYFGVVIENEARTTLKRSYAKANAVFLRNCRLRLLKTQSLSLSGNAAYTDSNTAEKDANVATGPSAPAAVPYLTNDTQRSLLDLSTMYFSSQPMYTPLHVAFLGVVLDNGDPEHDGVDEGGYAGLDVEKASMLALKARLSRQTACVTVLLNCLYDLLCVAPRSNGTTWKPSQQESAELAGRTQVKRFPTTGRELLVDALDLHSRTGETALLLAVRHNNVPVALRLLSLGVEAACMDRVTRLLSLELACANRCTPIAEALLRPRSSSGGAESTASTSVYAASPVLLNHAGIATALCWCAINNMPAVMQRLLECDGIDVESGFEGSSPLHLAIAFDSEEAALTLLRGTQPRRGGGGTTRILNKQSGEAEKRQTAPPATATATPCASTLGLKTVVPAANTHEKPFMDVNILHGRTHCTPLHLACKRGQLNIIRVLLQSWNAQLNIAASYTNYTPLLTALAHGREEAALRVLEYAKDQLRRGRAVLNLCAIDQQGNTALHLAARHGLALALEYMLVQFSEEEIARLAALHPAFAASSAYKSASCVVPVHAVNKHGKTALLVAVQYDQAETAELLVSMLIDTKDAPEMEDAAVVIESKGDLESSTSPRRGSQGALCSATANTPASMPLPTTPEHSQFGGTLIEGTCIALHQAHKKRLNTVVQLMLSAPPSLFPRTAEFCATVQLFERQQADRRRHTALLSSRPPSCGGGDGGGGGGDPSFVVSRSDKIRATNLNEGQSLHDPSMEQDRGSFVRLLLTCATGPMTSPNDALRVLLRGFALPELYMYLSKVASESAALGVQGSTAMAQSELLIGYLQEHAGTVVAPTRVVMFCRDVLRCLQQWMWSEASAAHERVEASKRRRASRNGKNDTARSQLPLGTQASDEHKQKQRGELNEVPMSWLCLVLLDPGAPAAGGARGKSAQHQLISAVRTMTSSAAFSDTVDVEKQAAGYRNALDAALKRKNLSLDISRMVRLYGRSQGGARAIEEIKSLVQAYVKAKANERARHLGRATTTAPDESLAASTMLNAQTMRYVGEPDASWNGDPHNSPIDVVGNEELFTTPIGFTVLQLAATLGLPEVVDFLVKTYNLSPLYAPAQDLYTRASLSRTSQQTDTSRGEAREEEEEVLVRDVVAHTVCALVKVAAQSTSRDDNGGWFYWTPYWLAVHTGSTQTVKTLLLAGGVVTSAGAKARLFPSEGNVKDGAAAQCGDTTVSTARRPPSTLVDYKEPAWLNPYQRTALQECIVAATRSGNSASASNTTADFLRPATPPSSRAAMPTAPLLPASLAMVNLLLQYGAQPNGLFDSTGSDAWLLALAGSGAADLPVTYKSYAANLKGTRTTGRRPGNVSLRSPLPLPSPSKASASTAAPLTSVGTNVSEATGQRCVDSLLRFGAPLLGCAPESQQRLGTHLDDRPLARARKSTESGNFDEQILKNAPRLLYQWRRLPCMRLAPAATTLARLMRRVQQAAGTHDDTHDDSGSEGDDDSGEKDGSTMGQVGTVFEQAQALWVRYAEEQQLYRRANADVATACDTSQMPLHPTKPQTLMLHAAEAPFTSMLTFTSAERDVSFLPTTARRDTMKAHGNAVEGKRAVGADSAANGRPVTPQSMVSLSAEPLRERLIAALRLCYRVVLLYTCVEYTPLQLLRLVHAFGTTGIPVNVHHPLSGDSVATRLLRKAHARLLAGASARRGGSAKTSNFLPGTHENPRASLIVSDPNDAPRLSMSVLEEPPCIGSPGAELETRALVDTCVALVHLLRVTTDPCLELPSASESKALSMEGAATGHVLCSVLFQPSCDGETPLSLAARIAHTPLISVLLESGAAASRAWDSHSRSRNESWHSPHNALRQDDSEGASEDAVDLYDVAELSRPTHYSLRTNLEDVVLRRLLATRVYYPAHEIGSLRILLTHMPNEAARRSFLRWVYPNIHPIPALQITMDNVDVAAHFLKSSHCMNALWANLLYARFTGRLDTAVSATAKAWNSLLRVVLPGAPAVPIYLIMRAAVQEEASGQSLQVELPPQREQPLVDGTKPSSASKKRPKSLCSPSNQSNWSHVVRCTSVFLQLMSMSVAETIVNKGNSPSQSLSVDAIAPATASMAGARSGQRPRATSATALPEPNKKETSTTLVDSVQHSVEGLAGTLLWDTIELAVRYDDKDVLWHLLQLRLPDVVLKHINNIQQQQQQQALSSSGTAGGTNAPQAATTRAMEAALATILGSYPSFAGVSTTSQATCVLERLQRLLWKEAVQKHRIDLLAVAAGSASTLRFLYTFAHPEVRAQMAPMRYDRVDMNSGMPEDMAHKPDLMAPVGASTGAAGELTVTLQSVEKSSHDGRPRGTSPPGQHACGGGEIVSQLPRLLRLPKGGETDVTAAAQLTKSSLSPGAISITLTEVGESWSTELTPETLKASCERSGDSPSTSVSRLQNGMANQDSHDEENVDVGANAELRFMESCVRNGRRPLAAREERRRRVTAVTWGLGAAACPVKLPATRLSSVTSVPANAVMPEVVAIAPLTPADVQPGRTPAPPQVKRMSALHRATGKDAKGGAKVSFPDDKTANVDSAKNSSMKTTKAEFSLSQRAAAQRRTGKQSPPRTNTLTVSKETEVQSLSVVPPTPSVVVPDPVYFMYLQLDWALHSTLLLRSPRPSGATIDTILFLLDQRVALSVPVLDLFLAGSVAPSGATPQELAISLRYQTREHQDTLLHLLVLHDQCQLAEYYLEYCYLWLVSNGFDPIPESGCPGRFPIDESAGSSMYDSNEDDLDSDEDTCLGNGGGYLGRGRQTRETPSSWNFGTVPREFLRCMLRVNAHGLTAFDYAHSPAMLQLLMWYGCVPPTYRPNPRAFRRVVFFNRGDRKEQRDMREAYTLADDRADRDGADTTARLQSVGGAAMSTMVPRKRELFRFFPVPHLVLASDNFVALMDPTGKELASTVGSVADGLAHAPVAGTANRKSHNTNSDVDEKSSKGGSVRLNLTQHQQQPNSRRLALMVTAEQRQLQATQRRHHQQERAKALLFDQVAAQSKVLVARGGGKDGGAGTQAKCSALSYLTRAVTAQIRKQWEEQRHPLCNMTTLLCNALEAQRLSASRVQTKRQGKSGSGGGGVTNVLPILLTEEVSLLHLGLCSFEDELVRLYGELRTEFAAASRDPCAHHTGNGEEEVNSDGNDAGPGLSTYSRLLLPPSVTGRPAIQPQQQQGGDREEGKWGPCSAMGSALPEIGQPKSTSEWNASRTGGTALPHVSAQDGAMGRAPLSAQHGRQTPHAPETSGGGPAMPPRLSQMDVVFLLEAQQFVVYPLSMPSLDNEGESLTEGGDNPKGDENKNNHIYARDGDGHGAGMNGIGRSSIMNRENSARPRSLLGGGTAAISELPAVIQRCTGAYPAPRTRSSPGNPSRGVCDMPASDVPLLHSLLERRAAEDLSSELIDVSARRYNAALMVSLTPMALAGIGGRSTGTARMSASAKMKNLAGRLKDTRWKQFGSRPVASGAGVSVTSTGAVALLNVPPFIPADSTSQRAASSIGTASDERGQGTLTTALGPAAGSMPIVMAARLEEWVARRWPREGQVDGKSSRQSLRSTTTARTQESSKKTSQGGSESGMNDYNRDNDNDNDDDEVPPSVLDQIAPVGGVATAAQQVLMRALLKSFTAATGAQLSEQMGLIITPNYDVVEAGDTAAALRATETKTPKPPRVQAKRH